MKTELKQTNKQTKNSEDFSPLQNSKVPSPFFQFGSSHTLT